MPNEKYKVELTTEEIKYLKEIRHNGNENSAKTIMHANVLINTNDKNSTRLTEREISEIFGISKTTVNEIRRTYAEHGLETALNRKTRISAPIMSKITGEFEAAVISMALSEAPKGHTNWTLRLLAEHCMEKKYIVSISHTAIGEMLNTNEVKPHLSK